MALTAGSRLGPYEVLALIGEGGMGQVYRARDTRLGRDVALKVLPDLFAAGPERLARFKREAHVLASLNHPHIAAIYGVEESGNVQALVLELVEGPTLADRIAGGPLPLDEATSIARQIADALEAAHDHGIVHRDLKPSNIKVRADGTVKVLDFGLAKAFEDEPAAVGAGRSVAPTITSPAATGLGVILGTAAYMSPEQARGKVVDRRADIWAFGCVLYEMLTGRCAFGGDEISDTLAAVLRADPEWQALPSAVPSGVWRLLHRCLDRTVQRRLQHIGEARIILEDVMAGVDQADVGIAQPARRRMTVAAAAWLATAFVAGVTATLALRGNSPQLQSGGDTAIQFFIALPDGWSLPDLSLPGIGAPMPLSVSPDGKQVGFLATGQNGRTQIWVRRLDARTPQPLNGTEGASRPFWSPDSRSLAFFADGKLKRIDVPGGLALTLCDAATNNRGGAWSKDGVIVFSPTANSALQRVSAAGGVPAAATTLSPGETAHYAPVFLPDGLHFLYGAATDLTSTVASAAAPGGYRIYVGSLDSSARAMLLKTDSMNVGYSRNHLLFARGATLLAQPFDAQRLSFTGDAFPVADQVHTTGGVALFSASATGVLAYRSGSADADVRLVWVDRTGKEIGTLGDPAPYSYVKLSADGKRASVRVLDAARGTGDIWLYDIARGLRTRFTFDPADEVRSHWSPDGSRILFSSRRKGRYDLYVKSSSGAGVEELFFEDEFDKQPLGWSSDGRSILFFSPRPKTGNDLFTVSLAGDRKPVPFVQTPFLDNSSAFSPDSRWIAYASNESGRFEIYVAPFPGPGGKWQISPGGGDWPRWSRGEIYYVAADEKTLMAVSVNGNGSSFEVGSAKALFEAPRTVGYHYDATSDGQRFLIIRPEQGAPIPITVVTNWTAGLKH